MERVYPSLAEQAFTGGGMHNLFEERHFPIRYPVVGVATFVLESSLYAGLILVLPPESYLGAYYGAGMLALLFNFVGHKFFTFKNQKVRHPLKQLLLEVGMKLFVLISRGAVLALLVESFGLHPLSGVVVSLCIAAVTFTFASWVFGGSRPKQTWTMVWGYASLGWWIGKEYVRSLRTRFP